MADDSSGSSPSLSTTLQDIDGAYSSKRIAAFIAMAAFLAGGIVDTVMGTVRVPPEVMNGLMWIVLGGLGLAVGERFGPERGDHDGH